MKKKNIPQTHAKQQSKNNYIHDFFLHFLTPFFGPSYYALLAVFRSQDKFIFML